MPRRRRYTTKEGDYLIVEENPDGNYYVVWFIADWDDTGGVLGEDEKLVNAPEPSVVGEWENWAATKQVAELADGRSSRGYYFETNKAAHMAKNAAEDAMRSKSKPWPLWAVKAKEAGWTPPKGWAP